MKSFFDTIPGFENNISSRMFLTCGAKLADMLRDVPCAAPPRSDMHFGGIRVYASPHMPKTERRQFRFPRSKKKRIRRKWCKDPRNWREVEVLGWLVTPPRWLVTPPNPPKGLFDFTDPLQHIIDALYGTNAKGKNWK
jgi:hypothetical protein